MILTIDIGGTTIKYSLVEKNKIIDKVKSIVTEKDSYDVFIKNLIKIYDSYESLEGIAIACPGAIDDNGKSVGISAIPCIFDQNIKEDLEKYTGKKVAIENDANCSLISELWVDDEVKDIAGIVIGTGIGGSLISNRKLIKGNKGSAGEIGLISDINPDGTLSNTTISITQAANAYSLETGTNINGKELFELAEKGDEKAVNAVRDFYLRMASLIMNIEVIFNPEKTIISGAIINDERFLPNVLKAYEEILEKNKGIYNVKSKIILSRFGSNSNLVGAAYNWYNKGE